jgi:hypothetical protein
MKQNKRDLQSDLNHIDNDAEGIRVLPVQVDIAREYLTRAIEAEAQNKELYEALKQLYFVTYEPNFSKIETFIKARKTLKDYEAKDGK